MPGTLAAGRFRGRGDQGADGGLRAALGMARADGRYTMTYDEPAEEFAMDVTLTPELERLIHDKVASGLYTSEDEVIREALRLLKDRDELRIFAVEDLRREVQKGLDQLDRGESVLLDSERIKAEGRRRLAGGCE